MDKNKITKSLAVFASVLLIIIIGVASFAYFGTFNVNLNNNVAVNINSSSPGDATFTSNATQLNLQVPAANMSFTAANNTVAAKEDTATLTVNLTGAANLLTTCTYDIVYEYDSSSYIYGGSQAKSVAKNGDKEITLQVSNVNGTNNFVNEKNFDYDSSWSGLKRTLVSGASISSMGSLTTQNISITGKYYNLTISQSSLEGKAFTGKIYVTNHSCSTSDGAALTILKHNGGESNITELSETEFANVTTASDKGMYKKTDDFGTSYYYRGAVNNNWVKFGKEPNKCMYNNSEVLYAEIVGDNLDIRKVENQEECLSTNICTANGMYGVGINETLCNAAGGTPLTEKATFTTADMYWRIIRINGDGSIRMIYSGTTDPSIDSSVTGNNGVFMTGVGTQINISDFNNNMNNAEYVGYMYTNGVQHGNSTSSPIKTTIENWYAGTTLKDNAFVSQDQIFCNDRSPGSTQTAAWTSTGVTYYYGASDRLNTNKAPILTCPEESDKFTSKQSSIGNKALEYPVGLITADEVAMAGGVYGTGNSNYYLYTGQFFWAGTPFYFNGSNVALFGVHSLGSLSYMSQNSAVRPVISLVSTVKLFGDGTYTNPYTVS